MPEPLPAVQLLFERLAPGDTSLGYRTALAQALQRALPGARVVEGRPAGGSGPVLVFEAARLAARARRRWWGGRRTVWFWGDGDAPADLRFVPLLGDGAPAGAVETGFGVDLDTFRPVPPLDALDLPLLATVCPVTPRARLEVVLEAVASLGEDPHCLWMHVGDAPTLQDFALLSDLRDRSAALDIQDRVEWRGPAPYAQLPSLYATADFAVDCTLEGPAPREPLEAMACGRLAFICHPRLAAWCAARGFPELVHDGRVPSLAARIRWAIAQGREALEARGAALREVAVKDHGLPRLVESLHREGS